MTTYRAGQRVRIEWSDGYVLEGTVREDIDGQLVVRGWFVGGQTGPAYERTVTILSEPRPEEPTGLGAVVEAYEYPGSPLRRWVRTEYENSPWVFPGHSSKWANLIDPVILSEGWKP